MGKKTDVNITASGLGGVTVVGVTISNTVGSIPTALVDVAPGGAGQINVASGSLGQVGSGDALKRNPCDLYASVKISGAGAISRKIKFSGLIDGVNLSNVVGNNSYQVVLKNRAQVLTELTTLTPGLVPASINIWKHAGHNVLFNTSGDTSAVSAWTNIRASGVLDNPPIKAYTEIIKWILKSQSEGSAEYLGTEQSIRGTQAYKEILNNGKYQKSAKIGLELMNSVDLSAVSDGTAQGHKANNLLIVNEIGNIFQSAPNVILENYMTFLAYMGCTIIFSNSKMLVVPANSVLAQTGGSPGRKALSSRPNHAYPADYNSYVYNDNGYRDVGCVMVLTAGYKGAADFGALLSDRGLIGEYCSSKLGGGSGVLVAQAHPFMGITPTGYLPSPTSTSALKQLDSSGSMVQSAKSFKAAKGISRGSNAQGVISKKASLNEWVKSTLDNYAETKMYQAKYVDRQGSITMDFNPNWVPGTGGALYVRETGMTLGFHVTNVTHRIDVSPPNDGSAITTVSFNCGRLGSGVTPGTDSDVFLGYNLGKEQAVQGMFIADNS